MTLSVTKTT